MKFLLDENFPCSCAEVIVSCGHEAVPFAEICKFGDDDETVFAAGKAYVKGELKTGYIFWPSLVPVNDAGSTYYLYRRCYLNNEKRYRTVDVGIFDSRGCPVEEERAKEVYGKYTFMRVL